MTMSRPGVPALALALLFAGAILVAGACIALPVMLLVSSPTGVAVLAVVVCGAAGLAVAWAGFARRYR